ncbi:MAG: multifunctional CCA addition/repair protein, partial [Thiobacillus sp.]|nr:multifunctional CCA addition/repair protein [Thiobacillus sp.]
MKTYIVGGAVRDRLLGLPVVDRDYVVVGATPDEMTALGYQPVGKDFPVFLHPKTHEEYALARTERKSGHGYKGFTVYAAPEVTLEEDLRRRDLTINAMAEDEAGALVDPYGGQRDLAARVFRHVSEAFAEDPVRILRVARFAARFTDFALAPETLALMRSMVDNGEIDALVPERVWQEVARGLMETQPSRMFQVLRDCGALARLFPEIDCLFGVPQPPQHHPEIDTGVHVMLVVDWAARQGFSLPVRFAALTHDLGKGVTPPELWPRHIGHEAKSVERVRALSERIRVPADCRDLAVAVARDHGNVHRATELRPGTVVELLERVDAFRRPERFEEFLQACECDFRGRTGYEDRPFPAPDVLRQALHAAQAIDAAEVARKTDPARIKAAIFQARAQAVAALRDLTGARWEHFPHQADMGVRGIGPTLAAAFEQAALAMTAVVTDPDRVAADEALEIRCEAPDYELLLVDWLNALILEMAARH